MKSRKNILTSIVATLSILVTSANSSPAAPERCDGTVQLTSQSNFQVRQAGWQTFVEFDFTGLHDICLADGSVVTGIVEGHLVQRISANGDFSLTFDEVLSYNGGTLGYRGEGSLTGGNWQSHVMTVGARHRPAGGNPRAGDVCVHRPRIADRRHLLCVHALTRRVATSAANRPEQSVKHPSQ